MFGKTKESINNHVVRQGVLIELGADTIHVDIDPTLEVLIKDGKSIVLMTNYPSTTSKERRRLPKNPNLFPMVQAIPRVADAISTIHILNGEDDRNYTLFAARRGLFTEKYLPTVPTDKRSRLRSILSPAVVYADRKSDDTYFFKRNERNKVDKWLASGNGHIFGLAPSGSTEHNGLPAKLDSIFRGAWYYARKYNTPLGCVSIITNSVTGHASHIIASQILGPNDLVYPEDSGEREQLFDQLYPHIVRHDMACLASPLVLFGQEGEWHEAEYIKLETWALLAPYVKEDYSGPRYDLPSSARRI